jgi:hypothetical protein
MYLTVKLPVNNKDLLWQIWVDKDLIERMVENYLRRYIYWKIFIKKVEEFRKQNEDLLMDEDEILEIVKQIRNEN